MGTLETTDVFCSTTCNCSRSCGSVGGACTMFWKSTHTIPMSVHKDRPLVHLHVQVHLTHTPCAVAVFADVPTQPRLLPLPPRAPPPMTPPSNRLSCSGPPAPGERFRERLPTREDRPLDRVRRNYLPGSDRSIDRCCGTEERRAAVYVRYTHVDVKRTHTQTHRGLEA